MNVAIRSMELKDLDAVIELGITTPEFQTGTDSPQFYSRETLTRWVASPNGVLLVAEADAKIVSFRLAAYNPDSRDGYLHTIAVHTDYRRQGIAASLMEETLKRLEKMGCNHVFTVVQEDNELMLQFLANKGFSIGGKFRYCDISLPREQR